MKRVCLFLLISICLGANGQTGDTSNKKGLRPKLIPDARTAEKIIHFKDSLAKDTNYTGKMEPIITDGDAERNIKNILQLQKEIRARQKRNAIIRIGIGILFLVVLIIGLRRRRFS